MAVLSKITDHDAVNYFKELPFYNKLIEKPEIKRLKDIDQLAELPFFKQLSIIKTSQALSGYAMMYKVEIVERKYLIVKLEASKLSIKDLFGDLLNETRGFKYQITGKILKNTSLMEKLNSLRFISIHWQKQWLITDLNWKILFKKFYTNLD